MRAEVLIIIIVLLIAAYALAEQPHEYIAAPVEVWETVHDVGWDVNDFPRWKPDSSLVLFDRDGNVPFEEWELNYLKSWLDVTVVGSDTIGVWMEKNDWLEDNEEGGE